MLNNCKPKRENYQILFLQDIQAGVGRSMRSLMAAGSAIGHRMLGMITRAPSETITTTIIITMLLLLITTITILITTMIIIITIITILITTMIIITILLLLITTITILITTMIIIIIIITILITTTILITILLLLIITMITQDCSPTPPSCSPRAKCTRSGQRSLPQTAKKYKFKNQYKYKL